MGGGGGGDKLSLICIMTVRMMKHMDRRVGLKVTLMHGCP